MIDYSPKMSLEKTLFWFIDDFLNFNANENTDSKVCEFPEKTEKEFVSIYLGSSKSIIDLNSNGKVNRYGLCIQRPIMFSAILILGHKLGTNLTYLPGCQILCHQKESTCGFYFQKTKKF